MKSATFWTAFATCIIAAATIVYTVYASRQWIAIKRSYEIMTAAESPDVYFYQKCVAASLPEPMDKKPLCGNGEVRRRMVPGKPLDSNMVVEFENFGRRAAVIRAWDFSWSVSQEFNIPKNKAYDLSGIDRLDRGAIRPSGTQTEAVERISKKINLTRDEVNAIVTGKAFLWVYGSIELRLFGGRTQIIRFCSPSEPVPVTPDPNLNHGPDCLNDRTIEEQKQQ
jgi:hypothetical protein